MYTVLWNMKYSLTHLSEAPQAVMRKRSLRSNWTTSWGSLQKWQKLSLCVTAFRQPSWSKVVAKCRLFRRMLHRHFTASTSTVSVCVCRWVGESLRFLHTSTYQTKSVKVAGMQVTNSFGKRSFPFGGSKEPDKYVEFCSFTCELSIHEV